MHSTSAKSPIGTNHFKVVLQMGKDFENITDNNAATKDSQRLLSINFQTYKSGRIYQESDNFHWVN